MKRTLLATVLSLGMFAACSSQEAEQPQEQAPATDATPAASDNTATAVLEATEGSEVSGEVTFTQEDGGVRVEAHVHGLAADTTHGFHVHETGDCSAPDAASAGGHFNPTGAEHGGPDSAAHHVGDLGNLEADGEGHAQLNQVFSFLSLKEGDENNIAGKAVIVHADADDLTSQPTGAAGARLACGVIE